MTWFLAKLEKGESYPDEVYWPENIDAFIPLSDGCLKHPSAIPEKSSVQLFWNKAGSETRHPLAWINKKGLQEYALHIQPWVDALKNESYRPEHKKPLSAMLPFHYHRVPGPIRNLIATAITKLRDYTGHANNAFPVSLFNCGCEILLGVCNARWDFGFDFPVLVLTHDIDSQDGFLWIEKIAKIEESLGVRSYWDVVPKKYNIKKDILHKLLNNGHEIGLHGLWHDNSEAFLTEEKLRSELSSVNPLINEFSMKGYRAPSWFRTQTMYSVLSEFFSYDLSCLDIDLFAAGNGGVGFMRPFRMENGLIELPCTLPFENPIFWNVTPEKLLEFWKPKIDFIKASGGMVLINTHPDPYYSGNDTMIDCYKKLLELLIAQGFQAKLPIEVVGKLK